MLNFLRASDGLGSASATVGPLGNFYDPEVEDAGRLQSFTYEIAILYICDRNHLHMRLQSFTYAIAIIATISVTTDP